MPLVWETMLDFDLQNPCAQNFLINCIKELFPFLLHHACYGSGLCDISKGTLMHSLGVEHSAQGILVFTHFTIITIAQPQ